jgi:hypothetical protein
MSPVIASKGRRRADRWRFTSIGQTGFFTGQNHQLNGGAHLN